MSNKKIVKAGPSKKRNIEPTLSSFKNFDFHIDIIGYCYEQITERKEEYDNETELIEGNIVQITESIQLQLGLEKYIELIMFIKKLRTEYVLDLRQKTYNLPTIKSLVFFDEDGNIKVKDDFDAILINREIEKFAIPTMQLKYLAKKFRAKKGKGRK